MTNDHKATTEYDQIREAAEAAEQIRRELPEATGGPHAGYSALFIEDAFAEHAPGDENDPDLRRVWGADGQFYSRATPSAVLSLLNRLDAAEELLLDLGEEIEELRADIPPYGPSRVAHIYRTAGLSDARDRLRAALTTPPGKG